MLHLNEQTFTKQIANMDDCKGSKTSTENITVLVGMDTGKLPYSGKVSWVRYYSRQLMDDEIMGLQKCEDTAQDYVTVEKVFLTGNVSYERFKDTKDLCLPEPKEFVALFSICHDHFQARRFCAKMGGRLIRQNDSLDDIAKEITLSHDVEETSLLLWIFEMATESSGWVLSLDRHSESHHMVTYSCDSVLHITACLMPLGKTTYIKFDTTHAMTLYSYNHQLVLLTKDNGMIRREPCNKLGEHLESQRCLAWRSAWMAEMYATLDYNQDIFGRYSWKGVGVDVSNISITVCDENMFTCDDGTCIPLWSRCDGVPHCEDNTDEGDVCSLLKPPPSSYWKGACPNTQPVIGVIAKEARVTSISLDTNELKVNLALAISWRDPRLTFQNLQNQTKNLSPSEYEILWTPKLQFPDARYEDNLNVVTKTSVLEEFTVQAVSSGHPETDSTYEGKFWFSIYHNGW